jgi:ATP-dependent DNA helicase DinG
MTDDCETGENVFPTLEEKEQIRQLLKKLSESLPAFAPRETQRRMIARVSGAFSRCRDEDDETLSGENLLVIQGPTGTGKTMGYLIPGLVLAKSRKKILVVSTATVSLQEQLVGKDLPHLARMSDTPFSFELAKGRGRYLCERNLIALTGGRGPEDASWKKPPSPEEIRILDRMRARFGKDWDGDRDHWDGELPEGLWSGVANQASACTGKRCDHYAACPYFVRREDLNRADIIVANHDLVLSDLRLGGGVLLPPPEQCLYVFDEGHHLPRKSLEHFREESDLEEALGWIERISPAVEQAEKFTNPPGKGGGFMEETETLSQSLVMISQWLERNWGGPVFERRWKDIPASGDPPGTDSLFGPDTEESLWRFPGGRLPDPLAEPVRVGGASAFLILDRVRRVKDALAEAPATDPKSKKTTERLEVELGLLSDRLERTSGLLFLFGRSDPEDGPPTARWVLSRRHGGIKTHVLCASPVWAGSLLGDILWGRVSSAVVTSATLETLGSFSSFNTKSGLSAFPAVSYESLPSPFRLESQGVLRIPALRSDPTNPSAHTEEVAHLLPGILDPGEGSLVLFSSKKQLEGVFRRLPQLWKDRVLIQGTKPRAELLEDHSRRVSNGEGSVLFGLASFSEGLDLKGRLCTHVVIAKIPFPVPTEPVDETLAEWIRKKGGDPFREIALPEAGLRLVQAAGRLIRAETDYGTVTILDRRLTEKSYGSLLLESLPPFRREVARSGSPSERFIR